MNILFDIGGTHFRYYIINNQNNLIEEQKVKREVNILFQLKETLKIMFSKYDIKEIKVSIAGIVNDKKIYGCMNAGLADGTELIDNFNNIDILYINDGDISLFGEIVFNKLNFNKNNILNIIFGTGVGCGLILNGKIIYNSEIHKFIEPFMKKNYLTNENSILASSFISDQLSKIIELLNLNIIIINGYVNNYKNFKENLINSISCNKYYDTQIIFSECKNPIFCGLLNY